MMFEAVCELGNSFLLVGGGSRGSAPLRLVL